MHYVLSDIHGHLTRFESIMEQINLKPKDELLVLGDVIDRNPDGLYILLQLKKMPNARLILGNHEYMMLDAIEHPDDVFALRRWYNNGGRVTHEQFNNYDEETQKEILRYLNKLEINIDLKIGDQEYILVHGAPMEYSRLYPYQYDNPTEYAVWTRLAPKMKPTDGKTIIFGHTPTSEYQDGYPLRIWKGKQMIGIDCGAAYDHRGRLACIRLEDMAVFYSDH